MVARFVLRSFFVATLALLTLLAGAVSASAQATTEIERFVDPFVFDSTNPCNGEAVVVTGELRITLRTTFDANGGFHSSFTLVPSGVRGVGESGALYKAVGGQRDHFNITSSGTLTDTFTSVFNLVSQGGGDNFVDQVTIHITFNANGDVTADVFSGQTECRG